MIITLYCHVWSFLVTFSKNVQVYQDAITVIVAMTMDVSEVRAPIDVVLETIRRPSGCISGCCPRVSNSEYSNINFFFSVCCDTGKWVNTGSLHWYLAVFALVQVFLSRKTFSLGGKEALCLCYTRLHVLPEGPLKADIQSHALESVTWLTQVEATISKALLSISAQWGLRVVTTLQLSHLSKSSLVKCKESLWKVNCNV